MRYAEMLPLMGKIVTVNKIFVNKHKTESGRHFKVWETKEVKPWSGWVVGFRQKQNGELKYPNDFYDGSTTFKQTGTQQCILVTSWPIKLPIPIPVDGYELGGEPIPPDNGGWKAHKAYQKEHGDDSYEKPKQNSQ